MTHPRPRTTTQYCWRYAEQQRKRNDSRLPILKLLNAKWAGRVIADMEAAFGGKNGGG